MKSILLAILLLFIGCTSSHRLVAIYESGEAVTGPVTVLEKVAQPGNYLQAEEKDEVKEDTSGSILDSVRDLLP